MMAAISRAGEAADNPEPRRATYREAKDFLSRHTDVIELSDTQGARVAICPAWQGRVMTSTCGGPDGPSFGFINREFIEAGRQNPHFNNYGAEDRLWLSPEGGRYSLWFKPGAEQTLENWFTPPAFNQGAFEVFSQPDSSHCRLTRTMRLTNAAGTEFNLLATRDIRLLNQTTVAKLLGASLVELLGQQGVRMVAFETTNTITNQGPPMTKDRGLVSVWILSMLNASPKTVVMVPYCSGEATQLGPVVKSDYFGSIPPERLKITPEAILFIADANYRSKIGTSQTRAKNILGSIDFQSNVLTLAHFTLPYNAAEMNYMNNMWGLQQGEPYRGDVANAYNDGPPAAGKKGLGAFYELESLSPAMELKTDDVFMHRHMTIHIVAEPDKLAAIARQTLGVDLKQVRSEMNIR